MAAIDLVRDPCVPQSNIEGKFVACLPDQPDKAGKCCPRVEFAFVAHFRHRPDRPIKWPLDNRANRHVAVLLSCKLRTNIEVHRSPRPPLRNNAKPARAETLLVVDTRKKNPKLGCHPRPYLALTNP